MHRLQCQISRPHGKAQRTPESILARSLRLALSKTFGEHLEQLFDALVIGGKNQPFDMKIFSIGHASPYFFDELAPATVPQAIAVHVNRMLMPIFKQPRLPRMEGFDNV
ncbi:MAG: hypothetical protein E6G81_07440 [Alphaproteobacteria bacterium]|nr:MAG: hypothetical protein E6G81_07440 [Alphaproteobacteria bacterium]